MVISATNHKIKSRYTSAGSHTMTFVAQTTDDFCRTRPVYCEQMDDRKVEVTMSFVLGWHAFCFCSQQFAAMRLRFIFRLKSLQWLEKRSVSNEYIRYVWKFEFCYIFLECNMQKCLILQEYYNIWWIRIKLRYSKVFSNS